MDAAHYLSCRLPRCTRMFFQPMRCLPSSLLLAQSPSSSNMPFHSSFIIQSTTRRSSLDPKSYKTLAGFSDPVPALQDLQPVRNIHRKLLPRCPTRDLAIEQHCTLCAPSNSLLTDAESLHPTVLVLAPLLPPDSVLPYYHPTVTHLALRFIPDYFTLQ